MIFRSGFTGSNGWVGTLLIIGGAILGIGAAVLHDEAGLEAVLRSSQEEESDWQLVRSGIGSLSPGRVYVIRKGANPFVGEVRFGADGTLRVEAVITIAGPATRETALDAPIKEATELCRLKFESGNPIFEAGASLVFPISESVNLVTQYDYVRSNSNYALFRFDNHAVTFGVQVGL